MAGAGSGSRDSPLLVHCGTGVSRTGVFIAVDYSIMKAKQENCVNVYRSISQSLTQLTLRAAVLHLFECSLCSSL